MTRTELANRYNELSGRKVKPTSYTKKVFEEMIAAEEKILTTPRGIGVTECPLCDHTAIDDEYEIAGEEGTPLGACRICPGCGDLFNEFTGVKVPTPKAKKARVVLNPQSTINKKTEYLASKANATLSYDRVERLWSLDFNGADDAIYMTSRKLSETSKEKLAGRVKAKRAKVQK